MRKIFCLILSCCMILGGCAENYHYSDHCDNFSADRINLTPEERKYYIFLLTPVSDIATECYCYTEDAVIAVGVGIAVVAVASAEVTASSLEPGTRVEF